MRLKTNLDLEAFFASVRRCSGEVTFQTPQKDVLNLKSALCLFVFSQAYLTGYTQLDGEVVCQEPPDEQILKEYMEDGVYA